MKTLLSSIFIFLCGVVWAQNKDIHPKVDYLGFVEAYYGFDFSNPNDHSRQPFLVNYNRHNTFTLNQAVFSLQIDGGNYRGNVGFQAGSYAKDNYTTGEEVLRHIYEATAGLALNKDHTFWIDAGIYSSHLGYESTLGSDNWNLTRTLSAELSPFFMSGVKFGWYGENGLTLMATVNNGWQHAERIPGNQMPGLGTLVEYEKGPWFFHWGTQFSNEMPDSMNRMRYFSDLWVKFQVNEKLGLIAQFDYGMQDNAADNGVDSWYTFNVAGQYQFSSLWHLGFRGEIYSDPMGVAALTKTLNPLEVVTASVNLDYVINKFFMARIEPKFMMGLEDDIFLNESPNGKMEVGSENFSIMTSLNIRFD